MLTDQQKFAICAAHFARGGEAGDFDTVARAVPMEQRTEFVHLLTTLDALRLVRRARKAWRSDGSASLPVIETDDNTVMLNGTSIGHLLTWHRTALPQEMQARIAYDSLIDRFLVHLAATHKIVALSVNDLVVWAFAPSNADINLAAAWDEFIKVAFSRAELEKSFVLLMNSVKLTDRGFGAVEFPIITRATAEIQAAFYLATLEQRVLYGSEDYKKANADLKHFKEGDPRRAEALKRLKDALQVNREQFESAVKQLNIPHETLTRLRKLAAGFNSLARNQFSYGTVKARTGNPKAESVRTSIEDMIENLASASADFTLPCPLQTEAQLLTARDAGDKQGGVCYACGRPLEGAESGKRKRGSMPALTANRFILAAPSQRLQSGTGQEQPVVCRACAAVAMVCPVKLTKSDVIVRLSLGGEDGCGVRDYLRMLTLGELNLVAGRYLLLKCTETVRMQKDGRTVDVPVSDPMGVLQYTLFKVATTLPRETLRHCRTWLVTNGEQELPTRWMVWLNYLQEIFNLRLVTAAGKANFGLFDAVRLVQKEEVVRAVYALITAETNEARRVTAQSYTELRLLDELRQAHHDLLKEANMPEKASLFRDVAALTGLLHAFCDFVDYECGRGSDTAKREVSKLIEEVTDPYQFCYRTTHNLSVEMATMTRDADNYFCFDSARALLERLLGDELKAREGISRQGTRTLRLFFDDVRHAYTMLFETTYKTEKEQKDFATELKLSLAAKFPAYFGKERD